MEEKFNYNFHKQNIVQVGFFKQETRKGQHQYFQIVTRFDFNTCIFQNTHVNTQERYYDKYII